MRSKPQPPEFHDNVAATISEGFFLVFLSKHSRGPAAAPSRLFIGSQPSHTKGEGEGARRHDGKGIPPREEAYES